MADAPPLPAQEVPLPDGLGVRVTPARPTGTGVLVLAGSSGRLDADRARTLAGRGAITEAFRWFGGPGQQPGPFDVPLESIASRVDALGEACERVVLVGTSFGAEAALLVAAHHPGVQAVAAFAPSDVAWAGVRPDGTVTSHWTLGGEPVPFVPFDDAWSPAPSPEGPAFRALYEASRRRFPDAVQRSLIAVERIPDVLLVAGADDQVWPSSAMARSIVARRARYGRATTLVEDDGAGHRALLPGEPVVVAGQAMRRGGDEAADRRLGARAWPALLTLL